MSDEANEREGGAGGELSWPLLLLLLSLPGICAMAGYWLVDHGHLLPELRGPVKQSIDENFVLWALWVYPSFLVLVGSLLYLGLSRCCGGVSDRRAELVFNSVWVLLAGVSLLSFLFYRSSATHAPDAVGEWASRFLLPLLVAAAVAIASAATQRRRRFLLMAGTMALVVLLALLGCFMLVLGP